MATDGRSVGETVFNVVAEMVLYAICLTAAWRVGAIMHGRFLGVVAVIISALLFARGEQCRRETRAAGDLNTDFYIMIPYMCGSVLLLRVFLPHVFAWYGALANR